MSQNRSLLPTGFCGPSVLGRVGTPAVTKLITILGHPENITAT